MSPSTFRKQNKKLNSHYRIIQKFDDEWKDYYKQNPIDGSWVCPYCGKKVYSMEVHPCNQPTCENVK